MQSVRWYTWPCFRTPAPVHFLPLTLKPSSALYRPPCKKGNLRALVPDTQMENPRALGAIPGANISLTLSSTFLGELSSAQGETRAAQAQSLSAARQLDDASMRMTGLAAELDAVRQAMAQCQARHADEINRQVQVAACLHAGRITCCIASPLCCIKLSHCTYVCDERLGISAQLAELHGPWQSDSGLKTESPLGHMPVASTELCLGLGWLMLG